MKCALVSSSPELEVPGYCIVFVSIIIDFYLTGLSDTFDGEYGFTWGQRWRHVSII